MHCDGSNCEEVTFTYWEISEKIKQVKCWSHTYVCQNKLRVVVNMVTCNVGTQV